MYGFKFKMFSPGQVLITQKKSITFCSDRLKQKLTLMISFGALIVLVLSFF